MADDRPQPTRPRGASPRPRSRSRRLLGVAMGGLIPTIVLAASACAPDPEVQRGAHDPEHRIRALLEHGDTPTLAFPTGDTVRLGPEVVEFYRARGFQPAWTSPEGFLDRGEALVDALHGAEKEGMASEEYHRPLVHDLIDRARRDHEEGLAVGDALGSLDLLLSEAFLRYTTDLRRGTVDPREAGLAWRIPRKDRTDATLLNDLVESGDFMAALDSIRPRVAFYDRLLEALARYRTIRDEGGWSGVPEGETLEEGDTGERSLAVRRRLLAEADPIEVRLVRGSERPDSFDADLARAVEHFQERHGIDADGKVGGSTLRELNVPVEERIAALRLNLDRWRWLPRDLGERYVLVNVAGFEAAVMKGDAPELTTDVVVGQQGWETPLFQDTLEYVVVNPYWNVPASIAREEILPAARRDPTYLARNDYEVLDASGKVVDHRGVDLSSDAYRIRQRPGPANALGDVKFLFPNDHDIYLHDTPADHLFTRSARAFSHGCIRVARPVELARYLFRTSTSLDPAEYDRIRATGEEKWIELEEKLPVYILYFTAWVAPDGTVRFYRDVYGRDRRVQEVARALGPEDSGPPPASASSGGS